MKINDKIRQRVIKAPHYRAKLLADPASVVGTVGRANVRMLEDSDEVLHLVIPADPVVFDATADVAQQVAARAQADPMFRERLYCNPRAALEHELGVDFPDDLRIVVVADNAHVVHIVLPPHQAAGVMMAGTPKATSSTSSSASASWGGDVTTDDSPCTLEGNSFCTATRGCKSLAGGGPCGGKTPSPGPTEPSGPTTEPSSPKPTKLR